MAITALAIGGFYYKLADKTADVLRTINTVIDRYRSAMEASSSLLTTQQLDMYNNLLRTMQNFQLTYSAEMEKTVDKIDELAQRRLNQIDTMVHGWVDGVMKPELQRSSLEIEALSNSLYFVREKPVLTATSPPFVSPFDKKTCTTIKCMGYFPDTGNPRLLPTLKVRGQIFWSVRNFNPLEFVVPNNILFPSNSQPLSTVSIDIKIPYLRRPWVFPNTVAYRIYKSWLSLLPASPGKITLEYTLISDAEERKFQSKPCSQNSRKQKRGGEGTTIIDRHHTFFAEPGWSIVPGSTHVDVHCNEGKGNSWRIGSEGPGAVTVLASTHKHKHTRDSGNLGFHIKTTVSRVNRIFENKKEELSLKWGESLEIGPSKKNWKVIFEDFDGNRKEYNGNVDDTFISIQSPSGIPILSVKKPVAVAGHVAQPEPLKAKL